jgi:hypothetical protein
MGGDSEVDGQQTLQKPEMQICEDCRKIDFSLAVTQKIALYSLDNGKELRLGNFVSRLDHFSDNCALCLEFYAAKACFGDYDGSFDVGAFYLPTWDLTGEHATITNVPYTAWLQPVPRGGFWDTSSADSAWLFAARTGWTACCRTTDERRVFRPQPIRERLDDAVVRAWLSACKKNHGNSCNASQNMPGLLLIDCVNLQLHRASKQDEYVALSYVWAKPAPGSTVGSSFPMTDGELQLPPMERLSQVIKDAISVTKQLHFRYLWIDKYCINQHDASIKKHQIDNMDLIYTGAEFTIIAAAGDDEHYGLCGVSIERSQRVVEIDDYTVSHMPPDPWHTSMTAPWANRAWVRRPQ